MGRWFTGVILTLVREGAGSTLERPHGFYVPLILCRLKKKYLGPVFAVFFFNAAKFFILCQKLTFFGFIRKKWALFAPRLELGTSRV